MLFLGGLTLTTAASATTGDLLVLDPMVRAPRQARLKPGLAVEEEVDGMVNAAIDHLGKNASKNRIPT